MFRGGDPRVVVSIPAFHARVRVSTIACERRLFERIGGDGYTRHRRFSIVGAQSKERRQAHSH